MSKTISNGFKRSGLCAILSHRVKGTVVIEPRYLPDILKTSCFAYGLEGF